MSSRLAVSAGYMPLDIIDVGESAWRRAGGTAGNVAAILAVLGWRSALAGRVGDDAAGRALRADLDRARVQSDLLKTEGGTLTNRLVHEVRLSAHRYRFTCPRCGQALPRSRPLRLDQVDAIIASRPRPDVYFFDRANRATVLLAERYAYAGSTVVFEPSTPANAALLQRAMLAASIVKGSHEHGPELVESYEGGPPDQLRIITEGIAGARVRLGGRRWHRVGVFDATVIDAAGAGDWTTAGMLHKIIGPQHATLAEIKEGVTYGHALAALNCAVAGARGLAEGRSSASIQSMAARVRAGHRLMPRHKAVATMRAPSGACPWCLLDQAPAASTLADSA